MGSEWVGWLFLRHVPSSDLAFFAAQTVLVVGGLAMAAGGYGLVALLLEAIEQGGLSQKEACADMQLNPSQWARQKRGGDHSHISLQRVSQLPPSVLGWWGVKIALHYGLPREITHGVALAFYRWRRMRRGVCAGLCLAALLTGGAITVNRLVLASSGECRSVMCLLYDDPWTVEYWIYGCYLQPCESDG